MFNQHIELLGDIKLQTISERTRRDLLLYLCHISEDVRPPTDTLESYLDLERFTTRFQRMFYLLDKKIFETHCLTSGYKFMHHLRGPTDRDLLNDIVSLYHHDLVGTEYGKNYIEAIDLEGELRTSLGKDLFNELVDSVKRYNEMKIADLIKESVEVWHEEHPEIKRGIEEMAEKWGFTREKFEKLMRQYHENS
ncbi:MAG: hypothetical protein KAS87_05380 [Candidatus Omnitrophica bacterium]|nr:hypothetical protein [Candidatus Omnitrophota bacterium]